jgi:hypothetical protein
MLNPALITDALVGVLQTIPELAAAMTVLDANQQPIIRISAFHYRLGQENRLAEAIYAMAAPSMLVAWDGTQGGSFNGQSIWKHRFNVYFRMGNAAGLPDPIGYEDLWWIACNKPPTGSPVNIRYMNIVPGLDIMDTPSVAHALDEDLQDRFVGVFVIPEIGDN